MSSCKKEVWKIIYSEVSTFHTILIGIESCWRIVVKYGWRALISIVLRLGKLKHIDVVQTLSATLRLKLGYKSKFISSNTLYFVSENVQPIAWATRVNIAVGVAKGLAFLHSLNANVIFRDLKASNILLDSVCQIESLVYRKRSDH